jgi:hypothetical protein
VAQRAKLPKLTLSPATAAAKQDAEARSSAAERRDREGKKIIAGHFPKSIWAELRRLAVDKDKTNQALLEEALADLFAKYKN